MVAIRTFPYKDVAGNNRTMLVVVDITIRQARMVAGLSGGLASYSALVREAKNIGYKHLRSESRVFGSELDGYQVEFDLFFIRRTGKMFVDPLPEDIVYIREHIDELKEIKKIEPIEAKNDRFAKIGRLERR